MGAELHFVPDGMGGKMPLCEQVEVFYKPEENSDDDV